MVPLNIFLGQASPITMYFVEFTRERGAMAGVGREDRHNFALFVSNPKHRKRVIDRTAGSAAVFGEAHFALAPREVPRSEFCDRLETSFFDIVSQFARITI